MATQEQDITALARALIREHGDKAAIFAAMEADACMERGDMDGAYSWRRVVSAVHNLMSAPTGRVQ